MSSDLPNSADFATTRWSMVLATGKHAPATAEIAFSELCQAYWSPLYAFLRRRGYAHDDAADLTQGFFAALLEKEGLRNVDPQRGRFRSYLLGALKHHVADENRARRAIKRGGMNQIVSIHADTEQHFLEPVDDETPERAFDREWAQVVLRRVMSQLQKEMNDSGKGAVFDAIRPHLIGQPDSTYATIADEFEMSVQAIKVFVHRTRKRFRERLRMEIADTVSSPGEIEDEIRSLFEALG